MRPSARLAMEHPTLYTALSVVAVGLLLVALGWQGITEWRKQRAAAEAALTPCTEKLGSAATCERQIEANSSKCFRMNYTPGTKTSPPWMDQEGYTECVVLTLEPYKKLRAERAAARRKEAAQYRQDEAKLME